MGTNKSKVRLLLVDVLDQPIKDLLVEVRTADRVWHRATTNSSGVLEFSTAQGRDVVVHVEHWISKQMKPVAKFFAGLDEMAIKLVSPKVKIRLATEPVGSPGTYLRGTYEVKKGDTLSGIAGTYEIGVDYLAKVNHIQDKNSLSVGQILKVPPVQNRSIKPQSPAKPKGKPPHSAQDAASAPRTTNGQHATPKTQNNVDGKPVTTLPAQQSAVIFPFRVKPLNEPGGNFSWNDWRKLHSPNAACFGAARKKQGGGIRRHAGRDLYAGDFTEIYAIASGTVLRIAPFYCKTDQVSIRHTTTDGRVFIVRYGELDPSSIQVKEGDEVKQGDIIGKTGILLDGKGRKVVVTRGQNVSMLHFELFSGAAGLDSAENLSAGGEYSRRSDLIDPLAILQEGYINTFKEGPPSLSKANFNERKPAASLRLSDAGESFIKDYEKLRLAFYEDHLGYCTVGWGHLTGGKTSCSTQDIKVGDSISNAVAEEFFEEDRRKHENIVKRAILAPLLQCEFDALCSLAFNIGDLSRKAPNLCKKVNARQYHEAAAEFLDITNGGNKGLTIRRRQENAMFLRADYDSTH
jgi:GH24 family phage-related lysozyme (muramidase)/murein DD-endopeptidase MepM/ murein hydrolase activator NlpD